jgi:hypothetical protein
MTDQLVVLDLDDDDMFHTDLTCEGLLPLLFDAEQHLGHPVDRPEELVAHAVARGLVVDSGVAPGMRWCRHCRAAHEARHLRTHALAA